MSQNYFNSLPLRLQLQELGQCRLMKASEFNGVEALKGKKIVIVGCGAQGLHQGLNLRDSGLDVSYTLRDAAIKEKRQSWKNAVENGFHVGTYEELIPKADLLINLTPDKQHTHVIESVMPLMKKNACLSYSHGFNIVEEGMQIRKDITVIMVAPKSPGTEVRQEYKRGFGVPTLIAVHRENDPRGEGMGLAKAYACGTGGDRAGVLQSSFTAEVKSDLMGEQTILCGVLQTGSLLCYDKMIEQGVDPGFASKLVQYGWETITEALKHGGVTHMMDRLSNPAKILALHLSEELKTILTPLYQEHMDNIMSGCFSTTMMQDWKNDDADLLRWRKETGATAFENSVAADQVIPEQDYFDKGILMIALVKAGVELAFDTMVATGIGEESAYYESLHELPLIANLISRKKLYEMNVVISDTAEYGCYLFNHKALPLLSGFMKKLDATVIGKGLDVQNTGVDNIELIRVNEAIRSTGVERIGKELRAYMSSMKPIY
ncbi:MAG: ketol-acid reductoisomerase [Desulfobacterales bacterium RIFOXYA12_FULL_46_15]|nr:MAG: ketol-acid reductoisomerase [Desulfobacula sp. GWF2_41_7]OGR22582.1 MAG: ketol-acid reductoisomerase [Desulfobacterales bacterium RIFOXYA12_FULL_46_15]